ncbi:hypothetical protein TIFTF001_021017 [Ficus carica]|uniref:Uncharacterized protein n=1 Tax=Ficus carica TaxID=3494 RepID=A0AA88AH67_FICCA|nr:hypothetical protein TIFTF001_021017 [Ficus carica]
MEKMTVERRRQASTSMGDELAICVALIGQSDLEREIRLDDSDRADLRLRVKLRQELDWATDENKMVMARVEIRHGSMIGAMRSRDQSVS